MKKPMYVDLGDWSEDERIRVIGHRATVHCEKVGFIVETEAKADHYIEQLKRQFPDIQVLSRGTIRIEGHKAVGVCVRGKEVKQ